MSDPVPAPPGATLANWRSRPFQTRAFQHVREIVASADIANDPRSVRALAPAPHAYAAFDAFSLPAAGGSALDLAGFLRASATDGLIVLHRGRIAFEHYDNGLHEQAPHIVMSASKSITGLIAGMLQARGLIDPEALVTDLMPELADGPYRGATVRQLLDMRCGIAMSPAQLRDYNAATGWEPAPAQGPSADLHGFLRQLRAASQPHGGVFRYVSANTDLLGLIIERVSGKPFAALVSELLWQPLGAQAPASITVDSRGAPRATGGFCMTLRDFARIGLLVAEQGRCGARQLVPAQWIEDMAAGGDRQAWKRGEFGNGFPGLTMSYRSGWYVIHDEPTTLFAMGIHGQHLFVDRASELVIAKLSSQPQPIDPVALALTLRALPLLRRCVLDAA